MLKLSEWDNIFFCHYNTCLSVVLICTCSSGDFHSDLINHIACAKLIYLHWLWPPKCILIKANMQNGQHMLLFSGCYHTQTFCKSEAKCTTPKLYTSRDIFSLIGMIAVINYCNCYYISVNHSFNKYLVLLHASSSSMIYIYFKPSKHWVLV